MTQFFRQQQKNRHDAYWLMAMYVLCCLATAIVIGSIIGLMLRIPILWCIVFFMLFTISMGGFRLYQLNKIGTQLVVQEMAGVALDTMNLSISEQQLLNVVSEMAIAANLPLPKIYLFDTPQINAFVVGLSRMDTVFMVSRGAVDTLDREELQALVAHGFGHLIHGNIVIHTRLMAWLFGLMMIGVAGEYLVFGSRLEDAKINENQSSNLATVFYWWRNHDYFIGMMLLIFGWIGYLFARFMQLRVSQKHQLLADATVVQLMRQRAPLVRVLRRIQQEIPANRGMNVYQKFYAHLMFAPVTTDILYQTHPDVNFRLQQLGDVLPEMGQEDDGIVIQESISLRRSSVNQPISPLSCRDKPHESVFQPIEWDTVFNFSAIHLAQTMQWNTRIPPIWQEGILHSNEFMAMWLSLLLSFDDKTLSLQLSIIEQVDALLLKQVVQWVDKRHIVPIECYVPISHSLIPRVRQNIRIGDERFQRLLQDLIQVDHHISLLEWCLWMNWQFYCKKKAVKSTYHWQEVTADLAQVLAWASSLNRPSNIAESAYHRIATQWGIDTAIPKRTISGLTRAVNKLSQLPEPDKSTILNGLIESIYADGSIHLDEQHLMCVVSLYFDATLPLLVLQSHSSSPMGDAANNESARV